MLATVLLFSCSQGATSGRLSLGPDFISFVGTAMTPGGAGIGGAQIYIDLIAEPLAVAGSDGTFQLTLTKTMLRDLGSRVQPGQTSFKIVFESVTEDPKMIAMAGPFSLGDHGRKDLGVVTLQAAASLAGVAKILNKQDGTYTAASGTSIKTGRQITSTDDGGSFRLTNLPTGKLELFAEKSGVARIVQVVELLPGENKTLDHPIVLFPDGSITGLVEAVPVTNTELRDLMASGHPYQRSFAVTSSPNAKFVRFHHDVTLLARDAVAAPWHDIAEFGGVFRYDFPVPAGNNLYVQFADAARGTLSDILTIKFSIDTFGDAPEIILNDGSGVANSRTVVVHVNNLTPTASKMRLSFDPVVLASTPWQPAQSVVPFTFPIPAAGSAEGEKELFVQLADDLGNQSLAYRATVNVVLFPPSNDVFLIEGGAPSTINMMVRLDIKVPPNAVAMSIAETPTCATGGLMTWVPVQPIYNFLFSCPGTKTVFLKFRDQDGVESMSYTQQILVDVFPPPTAPAFVIEDGSGTATHRIVHLAINVPPGAMLMRLFEGDGTEINEFGVVSEPAWTPVQPSAYYVFSSPGPKEMHLQFRSIFGSINVDSPIYVAHVLVQPFPPGSGGFLINHGDLTTPSQTLLLTMIPPTGAIAYRFTEIPEYLSSLQWLELPSCVPYETNIPYVTPGIGTRTIYLQYADSEGNVSLVYTASIIVAP